MGCRPHGAGRACPLLALWLAVLGVACGKGEGKSTSAKLPPLVVVERASVRDVPVQVRAPIDLRPLVQVEVGSKTLGYLDLVLVDRGDTVKKGQLLALVRPSDLPQQLAEAKGALAQVQASKLLARTNHERAKRLAPGGVVSQQELQQTSAALAAAEAAEAASHAKIVALAVRLGETRILSPIDGVVSQRRLDPGALVGPTGGGSILTLVRVDTLRAFVAVNERLASRVAIGQEAHIELDALPGKTYHGKVVRLAPAFDAASRTLDAEVSLPNEGGELRPGMYGRGAIVIAVHAGAVTVPVSAVQISRAKKHVFVVEGSRVSRRAIETGVDGETWLEVTAGLKRDERVVSAGLEGLAEGTVVRVREGVDPYSGKPSGARKSP